MGGAYASAACNGVYRVNIVICNGGRIRGIQMFEWGTGGVYINVTNTRTCFVAVVFWFCKH